ncbi:MAG: hypothetical protein ACXV9S_15360 [Acidimicrobiia bacterium]
MQVILRALGGQARKPGRTAIYFTMASTGLKVARRIMSNRQRTLLQFEVKPGEVFEIRGIRRGR